MDGNVSREQTPSASVFPTGLFRADLLEDLGGGIRHEGGQHDGTDANRLQQVVQDAGQAGLILVVLSQHPRCIFVNILVGTGDDLKDVHQSALEGVGFHLFIVFGLQPGSQRD